MFPFYLEGISIREFSRETKPISYWVYMDIGFIYRYWCYRKKCMYMYTQSSLVIHFVGIFWGIVILFFYFKNLCCTCNYFGFQTQFTCVKQGNFPHTNKQFSDISWVFYNSTNFLHYLVWIRLLPVVNVLLQDAAQGSPPPTSEPQGSIKCPSSQCSKQHHEL